MGKVRRALVTGARSPAALDIARDLARSGFEVHMADSVPSHVSRMSRAPAKVHRLRPPVQDPSGFRADVEALMERISPDIMVPTCEETFHLAAARADGVNTGPLFAPDPETLDRLHAKDRFADLAAQLGLCVPQTVTHVGPIDPMSFDLADVVVKACYSRFGIGTMVGPTRERLAAIVPTETRPWVVQQRVRGVEYSSYAIAVSGRVTAFAAYRSTRRLAGGAGYAFRAAGPGVWERMLEATRTIASHLSLTGQISLDAIDDGGTTWLIECNPRATSGVHLVAGDGAIAEALSGSCRLRTPIGPHRHNLPMMLTHGLTGMLDRRTRAEFLDGMDVIGTRGDRLPILGAVLDTACFAVRALKHGVSMTGATTFDMEWNGCR